MKVVVPNILMAAGAAVVLGVAAGASTAQRYALFGAVVLFGIGYFADKLLNKPGPPQATK